MEDKGFLRNACGALEMAPPRDAAQLNPLVLAYVGDSVYDLAVRTMLVCGHDAKANALHHMSSRRVCAAAQARALDAVLPELEENELAIVQRGRNAKPGAIPKNAAPADYAAATGLEALLGWLYLSEREERLWTLLKLCLEVGGHDSIEMAKPFRP